MSKRDWRINPVVGCLVGVAVLLFGAPFLTSAERQPYSGAYHHQTGSDQQPADPRAALTEKACATVQEASRYDPERHEDWDICAQFLAALAAGKSSDLAMPQLVLSVFGLAFILATLVFTGVQATAALASNRNTLLIGQNQTRAYLGVHSISAPENGTDSFGFQLINSGQTPARAIIMSYAVEFARVPERRDPPNFISPPANSERAEVRGGNGNQGVALSYAANTEVRRMLDQVRRDRPARFICVCRYKDVFGRCFELVQQTTFFVRLENGNRVGDLVGVIGLETAETAIKQADYDEPIRVWNYFSKSGE